MNVLLLFFALPVATIIFALVLQKLLDCPILVALTIFAIFLIVTFAVFSESFLVFAILYTILAYITAVISRFVKNFIRSQNNNCNCNNSNCDCDCDCDWGNNCNSNNSNCGNNGNTSDDSNNCGCCNRSNDLIIGSNFRGNRRVWR